MNILFIMSMTRYFQDVYLYNFIYFFVRLSSFVSSHFIFIFLVFLYMFVSMTRKNNPTAKHHFVLLFICMIILESLMYSMMIKSLLNLGRTKKKYSTTKKRTYRNNIYEFKMDTLRQRYNGGEYNGIEFDFV